MCGQPQNVGSTSDHSHVLLVIMTTFPEGSDL